MHNSFIDEIIEVPIEPVIEHLAPDTSLDTHQQELQNQFERSFLREKVILLVGQQWMRCGS